MGMENNRLSPRNHCALAMVADTLNHRGEISLNVSENLSDPGQVRGQVICHRDSLIGSASLAN